MVTLLGFLLVNPLSAADRAEEFLAGLRARGWHDVVLDYLTSADEDPLATPELLDRIDFEKGVTLTALAKASVRESERTKFNSQAAALLQKYAASHRDEPYYLEAMSKAASLIAEQALVKLAKANRLPAGAGEQATLRSEARAGLDSAGKVVEELLVACEEKLESLPKGALARKDSDAPATRQKLAAKQAESRLLAANFLFEQAKSYDASSEQFNPKLGVAAEAYLGLYREYNDNLVGFYGRLLEGRCYQLAGKLDEALDCYADLVDRPISNADFRRLVARAYRRRAECHLAAENLDDVIEECRKWLDDSRGPELKQPEWLAVAYRLAEAYQQKAASADTGEASRLQADARQLFREVSKHSGEFQLDARTALASGNAASIPVGEVKSFDEAFVAGKVALERRNSSKLAAGLAEKNNPEAVADLKQQADLHQGEALRLFQAALRLAENDSKQEDVLAARYYLSWCYYEDGHLQEAAVLGQFLALRYPESTYAGGAAKVALVALETLYFEAKKAGEDGTYEAAQLSDLAEMVAKLWPDSPEAGTAVNLLIQIAVEDNRLDDAKQLLDRLPEGNRAPVQLSLGSALWIRYLRQTATSSGEPDTATTQLKERAEQLLADGYGGLPDGNPSSQVATGVLYYVQLLLAKSDFQSAIKVLENSSVGPLSVVAKGPAQPVFVQETFKAALRAYLSVAPPQRDKAQAMMNALEEKFDVGDDPQKLTRIYLSLGRQLERQIIVHTASGKTFQAESVAGAFKDILQRISRRGDSKDWNVRNWIAQANLNLGEGLSGEAAEPYLKEAEKICREILADVEKDPKYAPKRIDVLRVRKRLGDCLQARKQFDKAFEQYADILRESPSMLDMQRTAASMLQQWGRDKKLPQKLDEAIRGALPQANNRNLIWGWLQLAKIASQAKQKAAVATEGNQPDQQKVQKYQDLYFEARYQVAKTRLLAAQVVTGADRSKQLNSARKNVESMKKLYPNLGGPQWQQAFGELLKQIEAESSAG